MEYLSQKFLFSHNGTDTRLFYAMRICNWEINKRTLFVNWVEGLLGKEKKKDGGEK